MLSLSSLGLHLHLSPCFTSLPHLTFISTTSTFLFSTSFSSSTSTQHLERLDRLCTSVSERLAGRGGLAGDGEARTLLSARDRLLREIGRNVRLGKLLKERLADPLVPSYR